MAKDINELRDEIESFYLTTMIDQGSFIRFLDTMAKFHKYDLQEQINIFHNASENCVALASEKIWNHLKRTLRADAKPVPIIKSVDGIDSVELIYDVSDTNEYREKEELLWRIDEERDKEYLNKNLQGEGSIESRVQHICGQMAEGFEGNDAEKDILELSLSYVTLKRMGYNVEDITIELVSTPWELENPETLLTEVNILAKSILNPMGEYIRNGRMNQNAGLLRHNGDANTERGGDGGRNGGLGDSGELRTVGNDENGVSDRGKEKDVEETSDGRESGGISEGVSDEVRSEIRSTVRNDDGERRSDGGTESGESDGVDSQGKIRETIGNGDDNSGNLRNSVEDEIYGEISDENSVQIGRNFEDEKTNDNKATNPYFTLSYGTVGNGKEEHYIAIPSEIFINDFVKPDENNTTHSYTVYEFVRDNNGEILYESLTSDTPLYAFSSAEDRFNFVKEISEYANSFQNVKETEETEEKISSETQKEIDDIIAAYEKEEIASAEALRQFQSLLNHITNNEEDDTKKENAVNIIQEHIEKIRKDREALFAEQNKEAERKRAGAEQTKQKSSDIPSAKTEPLTLFPEDKISGESTNQSEDEVYDENSVQVGRNFEGDDSTPNDTETTEEVTVEPIIDMVEEPQDNLPPIDLSTIDLDADMSTVSGKRAVFIRNIAAIRVMKQLETLNREATEDEAKLLRSYAGFGGMPEAFDSFNQSWSNEFHTLEKELTTEEFESARRSTLNAHFTPDNIVQSIYEGLSSLGFESGHVLEPSAGSGKFFKNMPQSMRENSNLFGVELDSLTARIAAKAYKDVEMSNQPFEKTNFADGSFDVAISNVPFGDYRVTNDNKYRGKRFYIHDYFINKMIDEVRPGGLVVAITSKGTMEKESTNAREEIGRKAELVTAIRLPDDTFKSAGTSVTTDILVFKKRENPLTKEELESLDYDSIAWIYNKKYNDDLNQNINDYFYRHTENSLGTLETVSTPWGIDFAVKSDKDIDVNERIKEIFASVGKIYEPSKEELPLPVQTQVLKDNIVGFAVENGEITFHRGDGKAEKPELNEKQRRRVFSAIKLRDITRELFKAQRANCSDETLNAYQKKLNQAYDEHNRLFGRIFKDRDLKKIFKDDPSYGLLMALEVYSKEGFQRKADIFTKRTVSPDITPTHADSAVDALAISMGETGNIDFPYMEELTGLSYDELRKDLEFTSIYQDVDGSFYTADEFLSGNIRRKIERTEKALNNVNLEEKELVARAMSDDWKSPPIYELPSPLLNYLQDRIDKNMEYGQEFTYDQDGRLDLSPNFETSKYIDDKLEEKNRDFLLFMAAATGNLVQIYQVKEQAAEDPLFALDAMKYKVATNVRYAFDGNIGAVGECLRIMGLNQDEIFERIRDKGLNGDDHEWYSFLREKFSEENPFAEDNEEEKTKFFEKLKDDWEVYKADYAQKYKNIVEYNLSDNANSQSKEAISTIVNKREWLEKNLAALKEVCPQDIPIEQIQVGLGTTFLPPYMIKDFLVENLDLGYYDSENLKVDFEKFTGEWKIEGKNVDDNAKVWQTYGTSRINALALAEKALNFRTPKIYDTVDAYDNGEYREKKVLNIEETAKAQIKQEELKKLFKTWIYKKEAYKNWIYKYYNNHFNAIRPREYNGEMLKFPRMNPAISLKPHQKNAIAHTIYGGNTLLAHTVGAGKTYEMVASAMESKRLGLCNKPMIIVPKHLTEQTGKEFLDLYPDANILVTNKKDFEASNRKAFCAKVATQDWDAVIMGYTQFEKITITPERKLALAEQFVNELVEAKQYLENNGQSKSLSVKALVKMIKSSEEKIASLENTTVKDGTVYFEDLGVDRLYIDEAHYFKNLWTYSKMTNVAGVNASSHAGKSQDLLEKIQYIQEINNGKGIVFATGTPISNSMTELYTMQKYLQPEMLKDNHIYHFDAWASTFGQTTTGLEIAPEGKGFREKTRFSKFYNLPELMTMFKEVADIKTADMLNLPTPKCECIIEEIEASEAQKEMVDALAERATLIRNRAVKPDVDNMLKITNEGRDLALDERNIDPSIPEPEDSKVKRCVKNVLQVYKDSEEIKGTQLIFCDRSTPKKDGSFSVYDDIRKKLIAGGVQPEEIEFVQNADTDEKKDILFAKVREGKVRVLLGGTKNLGVGTNVQDRLIATHDLDVPWVPADLEQRKGRIVRVGNRNPEVKVFRYVTKGTFDSYMWQLIENKQRFISQIMTSKTPTRESEDCDELVLSAAEIKAIATGDPLIREVMEIDNELSRLKIAKSGYLENLEHTRKLVTNDYPIRISNTERELNNAIKDKELFDSNTKVIDGVEDFSITINKNTYLDKKEGTKALGEALKEGKRYEFSGEYKGFKMSCVSDDIFSMPKLVCYHMNTYHIDLYASATEQLKGINRIGERINKEVTTLKTKLEQLKHNLEVAKEELEKPFPQEGRFQELENRSTEIKEILAAKEKGLTSEEDISKEIRINRIRKVANDPSNLPEDEIARRYLTDCAKSLEEYGETNFLEIIDDKKALESMIEIYNYNPTDAINVLNKYSPHLPSLDALRNYAEDYQTLTVRSEPRIAAMTI